MPDENRPAAVWAPAEPNPPGLCRRNSLCLPLADIGALVFRYKGQHLQHNVAEESTQQILSPPGVQQGHIQHHNINAFFFGEEPPLLQNFCVVAPQTVDALDIEQIVFFYFSEQLFILRAVKILARLFVLINISVRHPDFPHGDDLPFFVLFSG